MVTDQARAATPEQPAALRQALAVLAWLLVIAAVNVYVFRDHWRGRAEFTFDFPSGYYAGTAYWIASVKAGEWPHWVPYQSMGFPLAMNIQMGLFYLPFYVFPATGWPYTLYVANVFQILHTFAGAVGMFFLARACFGCLRVAGVAGVAFQLFGGFYTNAQHPDIIRAFCLTPWVLWALLLSAEAARPVRLWCWPVLTRLRGRNLWLPVIFYLFVTGGYAGNLFAGFLVFTVFLAAQAVAGARGGWQVAARDTLVLGALVALGLVLALPHLVPAKILAPEYERAHNYGELQRWFLTWKELFYLAFPISLVGRDYSMVGMQIPVVLLPFALLAPRRAVIRLVPFLAAAAAAAFMAIDAFIPLSQWVRQAWTPFGVSRFPAGDYRLFLYTGVLFLCAAGFGRFLTDQGPRASALRGRLSLAAFLVLLAAVLFLKVWDPVIVLSTAVRIIARQAAGLAAVLALAALPAAVRGRALLVAVPALCLVTGWPVVKDMRRFWADHDLEVALYNNCNVPLMAQGRLSSEALFDQKSTPGRPGRVASPHKHLCSWRGFVNGTYMMDGGIAPTESLKAVESSPFLKEFMLQPSALLALDQGPHLAATAADLAASATRAGPLETWAVREYGRNRLVYEVKALRPALVVENELYFPGWGGKLEDGTPVPCVRVAGGLRGWLLPAGQHVLRLRYRTPGLAPALAVAGTALLGYVLLVLGLWRWNRRAVSAPPGPQQAVPLALPLPAPPGREAGPTGLVA